MKTIELNEQQIIFIKHFADQVLHDEGFSKTTKMVAAQIITKLEQE